MNTDPRDPPENLSYLIDDCSGDDPDFLEANDEEE